jgi:hypothetical protein
LGSAQWGWPERWALFKLALAWWQHTPGPDERTVAQACVGVPARVMDELIEPLCVSALNLPSTEASAQVFWRVMRDALRGPGLAPWAASDLLLPRVDLGQLWPEAAALALQTQHPDRWQCRLGQAIQGISRGPNIWSLQGPHGSTEVDRVIWASSAVVAAKAMQALPVLEAQAWAAQTSALQHTAIATIYTHSPSATLDAPMLALRSGHGPNGAQFVFDRGQLSPSEPRMGGVWAWVVSACEGERESITAAVMAQAQAIWPAAGLTHLQTVVDKRAAYACRPGTQKPAQRITDGVWAAGDYTEGPYPSTLEAATRSGVAAALAAVTA